MTQVLQPGQHPDADQLSAFVEHALPPHEQRQMLAHLAVCPDCREIAYLAQPAVVEETAAHLRPVAACRPWFSWNLALPAALAVAFLIILTVHLRNVSIGKNEAQVDKTARLEQTPPLSQPAPPTRQAVPPRPIPAPIQKPQGKAALSTDAFAAGSASNTVPMHREPRQSSLNGSLARGGGILLPSTNPSVVTGAALGDQARQAVAGPGLRPARTSPAVAAPASAPAAQSAIMNNVDAVHRELRSSATQYNAATVAAQSSPNQAFQAAPPPPPPPAPGAMNETVTVTNAAPMLETDSNATSEVIAGKAIGSLAVPTLKMKKQPYLPSHLPALSMIANARLELAIDTNGLLFRSEDAGVSWQPIPVQWTGRAVKLQVTSPPSTQTLARNGNSVAATAAAKPSQAAPAQASFELTNDTGIVWISTDGQTWKHK